MLCYYDLCVHKSEYYSHNDKMNRLKTYFCKELFIVITLAALVFPKQGRLQRIWGIASILGEIRSCSFQKLAYFITLRLLQRSLEILLHLIFEVCSELQSLVCKGSRCLRRPMLAMLGSAVCSLLTQPHQKLLN